MCLSGLKVKTPMRKTEDLNFKSRLRQIVFSQLLSSRRTVNHLNIEQPNNVKTAGHEVGNSCHIRIITATFLYLRLYDE